MTALVLVPPSAHLRDSYRALIAEFVAYGNPLVPLTLSFDNTDFDAFLSKLADCTKGVGVSNIRHTLSPAPSKTRLPGR